MASSTSTCMFYCDAVEECGNERHYYYYFLDLDCCSLSLCKKPLSKNRDIFMYRGDTPFCSEDCRHQQMQMDHDKELLFRRRHRKTSTTSTRDLKQRQQDQDSECECDANPPPHQRIPVVAGAW